MLLNLMHSPLLIQSTLLMLLVTVYCINSSDASPQMELESGRIKDAIFFFKLTFALSHLFIDFTVYLCFCCNSLSLLTSIVRCLIIFVYIGLSLYNGHQMLRTYPKIAAYSWSLLFQGCNLVYFRICRNSLLIYI